MGNTKRPEVKEGEKKNLEAKTGESEAVTLKGGLPKGGPGGLKSAKSQSQLVKELLKNAQVKLRRKDSKPSLGDYIRLLQLQKELEEEEPREIRVSWGETVEKNPESGGGE
jgi:hypothetical protein